MKDSSVQPVQLGGKLYLVTTRNKAALYSLKSFVCGIYHPPQNIMGPNAETLTPLSKDKTEQHRALCNNMTSHQLKTPEE